MTQRADALVIGAGIVGLAHAYHLAKQGLKVVVFERNSRANGASIRNFGMLWPIGQPPGNMLEMAMRSREIWLEVLRESGIWHDPVGSLHLAYLPDEEQVLREFTAIAPDAGYRCEMWSREQVLTESRFVNPLSLRTALWSETEICVDPPQVIAGLPDHLTRTLDVKFCFNTAVTAVSGATLLAGGAEWIANHIFFCGGDDFQTLFPDFLRSAGMSRCKLQMMRSNSMHGQLLGPMLAAGLTLRHYRSFENCPSISEVKRRYSEEMPEYDRYGIHVMASQNGRGEIVIGDSHEYDDAISCFDSPEIDQLILDYLQTFLHPPNLAISARWHGIYAKHPAMPYVVMNPAPNTTIVTGLGGAGMTLSFGLAEQVVAATV